MPTTRWPAPILIQESGGPPLIDRPRPMPLPARPCAGCGKAFVLGETRPPWRWSGYVEEVYTDPAGEPDLPLERPSGWTPRQWHFWCVPAPKLSPRPHTLRAAKAFRQSEAPRVTTSARPFRPGGRARG